MGMVNYCEQCHGEIRPGDEVDKQPCRACLEKRVAELEAKIDEMRSNLRVFAAHFARIISEKAKLERTIERLREAAKEGGASDGE